MRFKDSFAFLTASLDKLVKLNKYDVVGKDENDKPIYQKREGWQEQFKQTSSNPYVKSKTDLDLLTEKGVYPYDYMSSFDKFNEQQLPSKEHFYSHLYEEQITDKDYTRANVDLNRIADEVKATTVVLQGQQPRHSNPTLFQPCANGIYFRKGTAEEQGHGRIP